MFVFYTFSLSKTSKFTYCTKNFWEFVARPTIRALPLPLDPS